jgi:hypothetical protein
MLRWVAPTAILCLLIVAQCTADSVPDENHIQGLIYKNYVGNPCVSLSDRNGPIGCRSMSRDCYSDIGVSVYFCFFTAPNAGISGRLHRVTGLNDLSKALEDASVLPGGDISLLVAPEAVTMEVLGRYGSCPCVCVSGPSLCCSIILSAQKSDAVVGLLFENHNDTSNVPATFSPADVHPNKQYGLYADSKLQWNPSGAGLITANTRKPWFSLGAYDTAAVRETLNASVSMATGAEFMLQMHATTDASTCLRRGWCKPVGGFSVLSMIGVQTPQELRDSPAVVAVIASADSASMFHTRSPGAVSDMSGTACLCFRVSSFILRIYLGTVALLGAMEVLSAYSLHSTPRRPAVFHWFTGEAWGYTGSKWFTRALYNGEAPYNATSL